MRYLHADSVLGARALADFQTTVLGVVVFVNPFPGFAFAAVGCAH